MTPSFAVDLSPYEHRHLQPGLPYQHNGLWHQFGFYLVIYRTIFSYTGAIILSLP